MSSAQQLVIDGIPITFIWDNYKSIRIRIEADGTVVVKAGTRNSLDRVTSFVQSKASWIRQKREAVLERGVPWAVSGRDGSVVRLWGQDRIIRVKARERPVRGPHCQVSERGGEIVLSSNPAIAGPDEASCQKRKEYLQAWLREQLMNETKRLLPSFEDRVGKRASSLRFRTCRGEWGSCSSLKGVITINPRLVHYSHRCLEYVITHELCHLHVSNHHKDFYDLLDRFYPEWHEAERELNGRVPKPTPNWSRT